MAATNVSAFVLKQKNLELYLFGMNSRTLRNLCYVTPKTKDNPTEIQRLLSPKRAQVIGSYIKQETAILPNAIVVSLTEDVTIRRTGQSTEAIIEFPSESGKYMYVLDGQHRLAGFNHSDGIEFDLPVVALHHANEHLRGRVFADINSKQVKVTDVHLLAVYYQTQGFENKDELATMAVVKLLAENTDSPLRDKVKMYDDQVGTWVTSRMLKQCLAPYTESGGTLYNRNTASQAKIFTEYLKGIERTWPEAWGNNKEYLLTRPVGIELMLSVFEPVQHLCDLNEGKQYTAETFGRQLSVLQDFKLRPAEGIAVPLDWVRGSQMGIGKLASGAAGRKWRLALGSHGRSRA